MTHRKRILLAVLAALTALSAAAQDNGTLSRPRKFNGLLGGGVSADSSQMFSTPRVTASSVFSIILP